MKKTVAASTDRAKASSIYRQAAQNMERKIGPEYSCWAINWVVSGGEEAAGKMHPRKKDYRSPYEEALDVECNVFASRSERILALCFMAAMVEAGDA